MQKLAIAGIVAGLSLSLIGIGLTTPGHLQPGTWMFCIGLVIFGISAFLFNPNYVKVSKTYTLIYDFCIDGRLQGEPISINGFKTLEAVTSEFNILREEFTRLTILSHFGYRYEALNPRIIPPGQTTSQPLIYQ